MYEGVKMKKLNQKTIVQKENKTEFFAKQHDMKQETKFESEN